ncbi:hypothetical protein KFE25_009136 [Diacronema lutheri]|uniref:ATP-dependent Clp protease proteolytic subunit n=1 Tax=Diacronema lutheri TaxID=2081491 RepID=A0A8J5XZA5_DIALT|nr:hypothetical protein KFE25_009136 [Diacronema lutheri]|mmetsp:Transcript_12657/g.39826  ORF Transcript_12657/g.39826 Transcript_12657/m.39826 type:complete len:260 (-) Transcript_12657:32-811(-)
MARVWRGIMRGVLPSGVLAYGTYACASRMEQKRPSQPKSANELFYETLPRQRAIYLSGPIDDVSAKLVIGQLLALEFDQPGEPITLFVTSRGGKVYSGLGIIDMMNLISSPVRTVCVGHCESMGAMILAAGEPGQRFALPHARIMLHQPFARLGDVKRTAEDVRLHADELCKTRATLLELITRATGRSTKEVEFVFDKDSYFTATEARDIGVIDRIAEHLHDIEPRASVQLAAKGDADAESASASIVAADAHCHAASPA